ncbi:MAG: histidine phosphatase family protein [Flavobacteriaceae bacterium]|nr:histidine phosphatase family protein [Flavobacteriaceae bacterium]
MNKILTFILVALLTLPSFSQEEATQEEKEQTTTYYFIRHAEKNRSNKDDKDPPLVINGQLRAAKWSLVFEHVQFDAIYSTDYNRTRETAQATSEMQNVYITIYNPRDIDVKSFILDTKGKTVLVVGHSNTTPMFVNAVIGEDKYKQINDTNNGNLYIVTISKSGDISDILIVIN